MNNSSKFWLSIGIAAGLYFGREVWLVWPTLSEDTKANIAISFFIVFMAWLFGDGLLIFEMKDETGLYGPFFLLKKFNKFLNNLGDKF